MLWAFTGREVIVTLTNEATFRGRIGWSWTWGWLRLRDPKTIGDDGDTDQMVGQLLLPAHQLLAVQVI